MVQAAPQNQPIIRAIRGALWRLLMLLSLIVPDRAPGQQAPPNEYDETQRRLVTLGTQALTICNGIFVSRRTIEQIYDQELRLNDLKFQPPSMVTIDRTQKTVAVRDDDGLTMRAVYRNGLGGIVLALTKHSPTLTAFPSCGCRYPPIIPPTSPGPMVIVWATNRCPTESIGKRWRPPPNSPSTERPMVTLPR
jgi:hypothetical protein